MNKLQHNSDGFSIVELSLVIVTLLIIGAAGYLVAKHVNKNPSKTAPSVATINPYAGWKSYCDTSVKLCFEYPSTWTLTDDSSPSLGTAQTVINASTTADVEYGNLLPAAGEPTSVFTTNPLSPTAPPANVTINLPSTYSFYTSSITSLANNDSNYKLVGGYYVSSSENIPAYYIVNTSAVTKLPLKVGKASQLQTNAFNISTTLDPTNIVIFGGGPITSDSYTPAQAAAWLTSTDGKATQQLMQSFYSE